MLVVGNSNIIGLNLMNRLIENGVLAIGGVRGGLEDIPPGALRRLRVLSTL
ncbi:hypothetical protein [Thermogymnomonas acidicola]|uniref:hypothetical protein n=1 Tax=Thermogymnomonas acidicola TaxID=399579 RepID=UPI0014943E76|nr:hypothetical protein [Thermogymnomonas acidicola]